MNNKLSAGEIYVSIGGQKLPISSVIINKSLTTLTDTFSFVVPLDDKKDINTYIPNIFGLKVDVFVNNKFYTSGILVNKKTTEKEIQVECSTHGWQIANSYVYEQTTYDGSCLGDFILKTLETNFFQTYDYMIYEEPKLAILPENKTNDIEKSLLKQYTFKDSNLKSEQKSFFDKDDNFYFITDRFFKCKKIKKKIKFLIYDPFDLYNLNISNFQSTKKNNSITSSYEDKIFDFIKSVTKNTNVFIKCLGILSDIKDTLDKKNVKFLTSQNEIIDKTFEDSSVINYVLLLYRPGFSLDYIENNNLSPQKKLNHYIAYTGFDKKKSIKYSIKYSDNKTDCNCLSCPVENFSGMEQYSIYCLRTKEGIIEAQSNKLNKGDYMDSIEYLKDSDQYFNKNRFDYSVNLGNIKNIFINQDLTEYAMNRRLNYEINQHRAKSYSVNVKVVGYTTNLTLGNINNWQNNKNTIWDFDKNIELTSEKQGILNQHLVIKNLKMVYDNFQGAYTEMTLIPPLSYNADELENKRYGHNPFVKEKINTSVIFRDPRSTTT